MLKLLRATPPPVPDPPAIATRVLRNEVIVVLALSVLDAAVFAALDLLRAPIRGQVRATFAQVGLLEQIATLVFGLAPVALVAVLLQRDRRPASEIGLGRERIREAIGWGALLAILVGVAGLAVYVVSLRVGLNRMIVPIPPTGYWWTVPVIIGGSLAAGLLEEVVVVGYLITRLQQLGWRPWRAIVCSALLRGGYHLYQGWGGFFGNVALGLFFGWWFTRTRRLWPLVIAHVLIDLAAGLGYLALAGHVSWL